MEEATPPRQRSVRAPSVSASPMAACPATVPLIALPMAETDRAYKPNHPIIFNMSFTFYSQINLHLSKGFEWIAFLRKSPLKKFDIVEAQPVHESVDDPEQQVQCMSPQQDDDRQ